MNAQNMTTAIHCTPEKTVKLPLTYSVADTAVHASAEEDRDYWQWREKEAIKAPSEIDVYCFHDALGLMYPMNWATSENGECESFMLAEMYCGRVTDIYARIGVRYFRLRDYSHLQHAQIMARVKEEFYQGRK